MQAYCRKGKHALAYHRTNESHGRNENPPYIRLMFAHTAFRECLQGVCKIVFCELGIPNAAHGL